jgi:leader peptidase (prepilin peptidase) / N-methyltransferase
VVRVRRHRADSNSVNSVTAFICGILGLAVGSFLNVVIWRVPRGESIVHPRSHCPACDHELRVRDNVPVLSWLLLHGRCRDCHTPIAARYPLVELGTAALFAIVGFAFAGRPWALPAYLLVAAALVAIAAIDLDQMIIPNRIVYPVGIALVPLLALASWGEGDWAAFARALAGSAIYGGAFFALWLLVGGKALGFGDVRLAFLLGLALGWLGWGALLAGLALPFALGSVAGMLTVAPWVSLPMLAGGALGWIVGPSVVSVSSIALAHGIGFAAGELLAGAAAFLIASALRFVPRGRALPFGPAMAAGALVVALAVAH